MHKKDIYLFSALIESGAMESVSISNLKAEAQSNVTCINISKHDKSHTTDEISTLFSGAIVVNI